MFINFSHTAHNAIDAVNMYGIYKGNVECWQFRKRIQGKRIIFQHPYTYI